MEEKKGTNITPILNHLFGDIIAGLKTKEDLKAFTDALRELDKDPRFSFKSMAGMMERMSKKEKETPSE